MNDLVEFVKLEASGNDFVVVSQPEFLSPIPEQELPVFIKNICHRHFGVGADGFIVLHKGEASGLDFSWRFFNSDGSQAEMCGNGARAVGKWACSNWLNKSRCVFKTDVGPVAVENLPGDQAKTSWRIEKVAPQKVDPGFWEGLRSACYVDTGVPHTVLWLEKFDAREELLPKLSQLRRDTKIDPRGSNVTLVSEQDSGILKTVTYERGVENYTLSCGTGVIAAAVVWLSESGRDLSQVVQLENPGGRLEVQYDLAAQKINLTGPAKMIFSGQFNRGIFYGKV